MTLYGASQDRLVGGVTAATVTVLLAIAGGLGCLAVWGQRPPWQRGLFLLVVAVCVGTVVASWAYRPDGYGLTDHALLVLRRAGDVVVPVAEITSIEEDPTPLAGAIRLAGNGGLFGFWGKFRSQRLGAFTAYATRRDRGVVVDAAGRRIVLTPDEPGRLVEDVRASMARARGAVGSG